MACRNKNKSLSGDILNGKELRNLIKRRKKERNIEQKGQVGTHPLWHILLFIGLILIFFPWSLLLLLLFFGWDESVEILRGLVIGTIGLAVFLICLAIWLVIMLVIVIAIIGML